MIRCAITNRTLLVTAGESSAQRQVALVDQCARLAREGLDILQLREKDLPPQELAEVSRQVLRAVRANGAVTKLVINSRLDVALLIGADGVHLSSRPGALAPDTVRAGFRDAGLPMPFVSVSCHTLAGVSAARKAGVSAILFGPVFGKVLAGQEVTPAAGLDALREACVEAAGTPILALGGVTAERVQSCLDAGAAGIAAIRMFL